QVNLSQAIADQGYLSLGEIEKHLENFYYQQQTHNGDAISHIKAIEPKDVEAVVKMFLNFSEVGGNAVWYYKYLIFSLQNTSQVFNEFPALYRMSHGVQLPAKRKSKNAGYYLISQSFPGEVNLKISLVVDEPTFAEMYKRIKENLPHIAAHDAPELDFVCEQFNLHNNTFWSTVVLPEIGKGANLPEKLLPPEASQEKLPFNGSYRVPVRFSFGEINFLLENVEEADEEV
ncbi:MAG: hypothetical protein LBR56_02880, partial [Sporomusaceae bacterium]|nr:hypothetical protein [Sporomusaceae bacterium]